MTPLDLAILFHETYERLAPAFGYETRAETRAFDASSPNGRLMTAVCAELIRRVDAWPPGCRCIRLSGGSLADLDLADLELRAAEARSACPMHRKDA